MLDAMRKRLGHGELMAIGGGSFVSIASGAVSLALIWLINSVGGSSEAGLYLFISALTTLVGAALSMGVPEYGQVLGSGRKQGVITIPLGLGLAALLFLVYIWSPGEHALYHQIWRSLFLLTLLAAAGVILSCSELRFRYRLLHSASIGNYVLLGGVPIILCIVMYMALGESVSRAVFGSAIMLVLLGGALYSVHAFAIPYRVTLWRADRSQFGFYGQRLLFVFIDTSLLVSTHGVIAEHEYVLMGVLTRVLTPMFIVLNVYIARRQALVLMAETAHSRQWWHLKMGAVLVFTGALWRLALGPDSAWLLFIAVTLVRYWVIALAAEFQQWLPESPMVIALSSFAIWGGGVFILGRGAVPLLDVVLVLVLGNLAFVAFFARVRQAKVI